MNDPHGTCEKSIRDQQAKIIKEIEGMIREIDDDLLMRLEEILIQEGVRRAIIAAGMASDDPPF